MTAAIAAFALGVCWLQQQAALPALASMQPWWWAALASLPLAAVRPARGLVVLLVAFAAGYGWAAGLAHVRMADRLPADLEGRDLVIAGVVSSLPAIGERS